MWRELRDLDPIRKARDRVDTLALVVRRVPIGDADLLVTLVTRERGLVSASARAARRASSRLGALEPMHTLRVVLEVGHGEDIAKLKEARIDKPRLALLDDERRMNAAGELLMLARRAIGPAAADPRSFEAVDRGLDAIAAAPSQRARAFLAWAGARLLDALGYALEFGGCVRCGTPCPPGSAAYVDPAAGGLVCRACGGGPLLLTGAQRERVATWLADATGELTQEDEDLVVRIVDQAVSAH